MSCFHFPHFVARLFEGWCYKTHQQQEPCDLSKSPLPALRSCFLPSCASGFCSSRSSASSSSCWPFLLLLLFLLVYLFFPSNTITSCSSCNRSRCSRSVSCCLGTPTIIRCPLQSQTLKKKTLQLPQEHLSQTHAHHRH